MAKPYRRGGKWQIQWFDENGKRKSATFESYNAAVRAEALHRAEVDEIERGVRAAVAPRKTFDDLIEYWTTHRAIRKRSARHDESIIRAHLRPAFGGLLLEAVNIERVDTFIAERRHLNPKTISNLLTLLISMLNVALDLGWIAKAPRITKPRVRMHDSDFRYLRTDGEISRVLNAARAEGEHIFIVYATAIYTGLRAGELAGLRWSDIDFATKRMTVQRSYDGPTKAGDVRYVPILDALLPSLREWRLRCGGDVVFPNESGGRHGPSARIFQEVLHRTLERAGLGRKYITFHGLRHTFASLWMMKGGDLFKLQKILGHKSIQMTQRYAHLAPEAFAEDYGRFPALPCGEAPVVALVR